MSRRNAPKSDHGRLPPAPNTRPLMLSTAACNQFSAKSFAPSIPSKIGTKVEASPAASFFQAPAASMLPRPSGPTFLMAAMNSAVSGG